MDGLSRLERDRATELAVLARLEPDGQDADLLLGEQRRDLGEHPRTVEAFDVDSDDERRRHSVRPGDLDDALRGGQQVARVRTVLAMYGDALAPRHEADDLVAGHRCAAARQLDPHRRVAVNLDAGLAALRLARGSVDRVVLERLLGRVLGRALKRDDVVDDGLGADMAPVSYTHLRAHETVLDIVCR